jgi:subtilase family serine protease
MLPKGTESGGNVLGRLTGHCIAAAWLAVFAVDFAAFAQGGHPVPLVTQPLDETKLVSLAGNTRPEATPANDRGIVADSLRLDHLLLQLKRSPQQEILFTHFLDQLHDTQSPNYHKWLTAAQYEKQFGIADADRNVVTGWLAQHGFTVHGVLAGMIVDFSGNAGQVRAAFHTEIHHLEVNGKPHIANIADPRIPAGLVPIVTGTVSLHDFKPYPTFRPRIVYTPSLSSSSSRLVGAADLAIIYNFIPLFAAGYSGQGQTIAVLEDTDVYSTGDWSIFRKTFGLALKYPRGSFTQIHPGPGTGGTCTDPGANGNDAEATLDAEWATAAAPSAAIVLASCADTVTNFGGFIALQNLLTNGGTPPPVISISYGNAEPELGAAGNAYINSLYQLAVAQGVSVFVATGDGGAANADVNSSAASHGINVSGFASTPYNVAVGGTDFEDLYLGTTNSYWNSSNGLNFLSALSYIPEIPWNDSCASVLLATYVSGNGTTYGSNGFCSSSAGQSHLTTSAGGGGPSACATGSPSTTDVVSGSCAGYAKPSWQTGFAGVHSDGVRDIPDVSLFAANGIWGHYYVVCFSDGGNGGASCLGSPSTWSGFGGTSVSTPIMAGIQALVNQKTASLWGNPNPTLYALASAEYGSNGASSCNSSLGNGTASGCIFYDVTAGDMDVNCTGTHNCFSGVLSTANASYRPSYTATTGWDFATGIGTVNAYNLVMNWP